MKRVLIALLLALSVAVSAAEKKEKEDPTVRSVQGAVTDADSNPVNGAVVHLKNAKTLQIRSYITKEDGKYIFQGLSTNIDYELKAEHQGASSDSKRLGVFDSRSKAVVNLKLNKK